MSCGKPCACPTYRDHLLTVSVASAALPSRRVEARQQAERTKRWERDMPAYKRLRDDGLQPPSIDGSADLEAKANHPLEIQAGRLME